MNKQSLLGILLLDNLGESMTLVSDHQETQVVDKNANLVEELNELKEQTSYLNDKTLELQSQIDAAKAKQKQTGEYADAQWFSDTKTAIRENTNKLHLLNRRIRDIRSQLSRSNPKAAYFQQAARKVLSPEIYTEINSLANQWMTQKV